MTQPKANFGFLKLIHNTVQNSKRYATIHEIHASLRQIGIDVDLETVIAAHDNTFFCDFISELFPDQEPEQEQDAAEETQKKQVKNWNRLLADKLDRILMFITEDEDAPYISSEHFKNRYIRE